MSVLYGCMPHAHISPPAASSEVGIRRAGHPCPTRAPTASYATGACSCGRDRTLLPTRPIITPRRRTSCSHPCRLTEHRPRAASESLADSLAAEAADKLLEAVAKSASEELRGHLRDAELLKADGEQEAAHQAEGAAGGRAGRHQECHAPGMASPGISGLGLGVGGGAWAGSRLLGPHSTDMQ